jgi:ankyrin repeat protein
MKTLSLVVPLLMTLKIAAAAAADGDLRLVEAAGNRDVQQIRALLNQRVDVNVKSHDGATAFSGLHIRMISKPRTY